MNIRYSLVLFQVVNRLLLLIIKTNILRAGFDTTSTLRACCGSGGQYKYSSSTVCGSINFSVCSQPDQYISWDGMHMTQKAYEFLAKWLVADILPQLNCNNNISYEK